ncbi:hypothetical protein ABEG10_00965 [Burkholderia cenocepacia]|uniref:hypothetical protein n=1 Tax=Burkholderia cenocepacia TaxID=95486 RepID=UPI001AA1BA0A|nr:hypothetical protein [Burkholderia cenocepacia]MBO1852097.1 hypothetical protein [Burkholderia cenocepacia]MCO8326229.1 hypothetical protein [Burkholderia cenocepacia]MCO8333292.1 hypothetical protein [Burkholderia cenocepacia]MCO8340666.1 hypothetical protein [Burkholderia cenocepacia]MCO8348085.1 hypothetical protein [Burkholderia cenocepacia]
MARVKFRIRRIPQARTFNGQLYAPGSFQVQRRVGWLFWREIAICRDRGEADLRLNGAVREQRLARLKPLLVAVFDAEGMELRR